MRKIEKIIIHCSDSSFGDVAEIRKWHKERGFCDIGYHYVILNGKRSKEYVGSEVGMIEKGRADDVVGAHVKGMNSISIGICMIGVQNFYRRQFWSCLGLVSQLLRLHNLTVNDVLGHCETPTGKEQGKTCPNFDIDVFRTWLKWFVRLKM